MTFKVREMDSLFVEKKYKFNKNETKSKIENTTQF